MRLQNHIALFAALALAGCAALPGGFTKALDTFELSSLSAKSEGRRLPQRQLLVAEPVALKPLDGENIVIRDGRTSVQYLSGAQWSDRLPRIVQARLAEAYQRSGRLGGVGLPGQGIAVDYQIVTEIRAFEIRVGGGDAAVVEIWAKLLNDRNGVVRASRIFTASEPVSGPGNDRFIAALDAAFAQAAGEIVDWTLRSM